MRPVVWVWASTLRDSKSKKAKGKSEEVILLVVISFHLKEQKGAFVGSAGASGFAHGSRRELHAPQQICKARV